MNLFCKARLLSQNRKNNQFICKRQLDGGLRCPVIKKQKVLLAIQPINTVPLQDLRDVNKTAWALTYPAFKIFPTGSLR